MEHIGVEDDSSASSPNYYDYDYENTSTESPDSESFDLGNSRIEGSDYGEYHEYSGLLEPKDIQIRAGVNKLDDDNGIVYEVEKIIMHENYTTNPNVYYAADIALIRVAEDIIFNDRIQPVKLASSSSEDLLPVGAPVVVTGWGYTQACMEVTEETTNDLRMAKMIIYDFDKCQNDYLEELQKTYQTDVTESLGSGLDRGMICCIGHSHTCKGDSGGPVVDERGIQVGIVSFGFVGLPDVNTNVWFYSEWIASNSKITES
ncbi:chymotrypsin-1-like [Trichogramma pretiosum]|uniref:chymotrypsin-1-like n=1 Tax=Trichogramma pretiosum TaxID=7493 RepID=UPI0006C9BD41|nr:chymotrypsin-1-like [Trichogramma pretiosum]